MEQYISKDALVAEILRKRKAIPKNEDDIRMKAVYGNEAFVLTELLEYIDTLEVKEVDLEKIIDSFFQRYKNGDNELLICDKTDFSLIAKHFFELGIAVSNKAQKGE